MSLGDDNGYGNDSGRTDDAYSTIGGTRQTRTRLPDGEGGDGYNAPRRPARASRSLITMAACGRPPDRGHRVRQHGRGRRERQRRRRLGKRGSKPEAASTAATGTKPVTGKNGTIPSGFAHDEQGAQSAASNYAVALGSVGMFSADTRRSIVQTTHDPAVVESLLAALTKAYSPGFLKNVGLNEDGTTPSGLTFVSRTIPVGTKVTEKSGDTATVEVWCTGLVGMAGPGSTKPVTATWFTISEKLKWVGDDWRIESSSQKEGPTP